MVLQLALNPDGYKNFNHSCSSQLVGATTLGLVHTSWEVEAKFRIDVVPDSGGLQYALAYLVSDQKHGTPSLAPLQVHPSRLLPSQRNAHRLPSHTLSSLQGNPFVTPKRQPQS